MHVKDLQKTPIKDLTFAVVDVETTGMSPGYNRVIDIGVVKTRNGTISETWETLIDPKQKIGKWITYYTNLRDCHVRGKPTFDRFVPKIQRLLEKSVFVAHNVNFDYSFLTQEMRRIGREFNYPRICTVQLGRKLLPQLANAHLDALSDYYNIKISQRHRALPDALATAEVLNNFIEIAREKYGAKTYFDLERLQRLKIPKDKYKRIRNYRQITHFQPNLF
jgi:DNA polymerase-3 subunit epsilon